MNDSRSRVQSHTRLFATMGSTLQVGATPDRDIVGPGAGRAVESTVPTHLWRRRLGRANRHGFGWPPGHCRERRRTGGGFGVRAGPIVGA